MKAFYASSFGGPEVMTFGELPDPEPRAHEVLVAVEASSLNPVDWKVRLGDHKVLSGSRFPKIFGGDYAGVVQQVGAKVSSFRAGDRVYGFRAVLLGAIGAHAELVVAKSASVRRMPEGLSFVQAAALPVAGLTALSGFRLAGEVAGKAVLVNGATGGVGHFAVQIAKARGAHVTAVCSAKNRDRALALGADQVLDYRMQGATPIGQRFDVIFDAFGGSSYGAAASQLSRGGVFLTTIPSAKLVLGWVRSMFSGHRVRASNARVRPADYQALEELLATGAVAPVTDAVFPIARAPEAFALAEAGGVVGKIVLTLR
ncbi:MAG: Alcohol dehydrogenase zinc-binding domain protein [Deltaproteobacteria bacterium]|nr:Alcohol dehydrogenase zinc-binding domain protein [Deltaproteobacteria bacterium]